MASTLHAPSGVFQESLGVAVTAAATDLRQRQREDGGWCFELEADCTIPSEYILMMHFLDEIDPEIERKLATYIGARQLDDGGWPLYPGGAFDMSCSVKAYFALKLAGDSPDAEGMRRARNAILGHGGAARSNVFTRIALAMFRQIPWAAVPYMPPEIVLLPSWFPFSLARVSYWSRTVVVPLLVLVHAKPAAANPRKVGISELFTVDPDAERAWFPANTLLQKAFLGLDRVTRPLDRLVPGRVRRRSIARAERWVLERLNGENGLGAIFPAMVNAYEMLRLLGYGAQHPLVRQCRTALRRLLVDRGDEAYCQPCVSPVWDTALACLALQACPGDPDNRRSLRRALHWLTQRQLDREPGDWRDAHPDLLGGGWAFQFANPHYPDLDDTAAVAWALWQSHPDGAAAAADERIHRAADWLCGMQSRNGGFAAFDSDNTSDYLNAIPFADHGALLDPPTSDVTARCVALLSRLNRARDREVLERALRFLGREQEQDGGWYGRWGTNYIYGTWSVLSALETVPKAPDTIRIGDAVAWLKRRQGADGGWGESNDSYLDPARGEQPGTPFQTAWAMLALMAAGEPDGPALRAGAQFLLRRQRADGSWSDGYFTAPGFPRVFYLRYHGYNAYFPLWALARYERLLGRSGAAEGA